MNKLIALALLAAAPLLAQQTRLDPRQIAPPAALLLAPAVTAQPGDTVTLNLTFKPAGGQPAGLQWSFLYSTSDVALISVAPGPAVIAAAKSIACAGSGGTYTCLATGINTNLIAGGVAAVVTITLAPTVSSSGIGLANTMGATLGGDLYPVGGMGARISGQ